MCGIIGYVGPQGTDVTTILLDGLTKLEYRGYDSAGIAVLTTDGTLELRRRAGKIANLVASVENGSRPAEGTLGIGHTRWATHGRPNDTNAHPHPRLYRDYHRRPQRHHRELCRTTPATAKRGPYLPLRNGYRSIVAPDRTVLLWARRHATLNSRCDSLYSVCMVRMQLPWSVSEQPDLLIGARCGGGPLIVGLGEHEQFLSSDIPALLTYTRRVLILEEGEIAVLHADSVSLTTLKGTPIERAPLTIDWDAEAAEKGGYPHFTLKEIHEQPEAMRRALTGRVRDGQLHLVELERMQQAGLLDNIQRIIIVACGTSYHTGLIAKYVIEQWARIPVEAITAAEFRYCNPIVGPETLCIAVTQSGETADTLVGIRQAREHGAPVIAVTNVVASAITRLSDAVLYLQAGPEIGVVATKTFISSLTVLYLLGLYLAQLRGRITTSNHTSC